MSGIDDLLGGLLGGGKGGGQAGGLGDLLGGLLGGARGGGGGGGGGMDIAGLAVGLAPLLQQFLGGGGLGALLDRFKQQGMGEQVDSWVSTGANEPISAEQVQSVLSGEQIADVAGRLGVSDDEAASVLAGVIPGVVDAVTPEGTLPSEEELRARFGG
jgi:uncharacterized protein YidB (DUF937 family)